MSNALATDFFLEIRSHENIGKTIPLPLGEFIVGRLGDCDLVLSNDNLISRKHAKFTINEAGCFVENMGSLNGVFVNKNKISQKQILNPGDEIIIGNHLLVLQKGIGKDSGMANEESPNTANASPATSVIRTPQDASRRMYLLYQLINATLNSNSIEALMRTILNLIFQDLRVERGCIYLLNPQNQQMQPVCYKVKGEDQKILVFHPSPDLIAQALAEKKVIIKKKEDLKENPLTGVCMFPLLEGDHLFGLIYIDTTYPKFSLDKTDLDFLDAISKQSSTSLSKARLANDLQKEQELIKHLEKHVGSQVTDIVRKRNIDVDSSYMETQELEVAILFSDIVGFTSLSEKLSPGEIAFLLNGYFNYMAECVITHNGYLNKYIGDAVMAVFGAPHTAGNDSENSIRCALEMLEKLQIFWKSIDESKRFQIRIGINTGVVIAGNIGSLSRMEYTVIGDPVNLASRLESKASANTVLIGESTYKKVEGIFQTKQLGSIKVKGKEEPVLVYQVLK